MKKRFFTLTLMMIVGAAVLHAQTTITYNNHAPQVGQMITVKTLMDPADAQPGPEGANVTWDYSEFVGDDEFTTTYIDPAQTPFADSLTGLDVNVAMGIFDEEDSGYGFVNANQQNVSMKAIGFMVEGEPAMFSVFDPSPLVMKFPFAYGDTYDTYGEFSFDVGGQFLMITKEWSTSVADAWGTLTNPVTTYNNVLRVKTTTLDSTFMYMDGQLISADGYEYIDYAWYNAGNRHPVQTLSGEMDGDDFFADGIDYLYEESAGISDPGASQLSVYPNPVSDVIYIDQKPENMPGSYVISDMMGRVVLETKATGNDQIHVSHLSEGMYMLQEMKDNRVISSAKLLIKR
jgi:hypothetical protein